MSMGLGFYEVTMNPTLELLWNSNVKLILGVIAQLFEWLERSHQMSWLLQRSGQSKGTLSSVPQHARA